MRRRDRATRSPIRADAARSPPASSPTTATIVVEHFRDEIGSVRVVLHAPFGGRVNAPWGMALAQRVRESLGGVDVQVQTTDDGLMLRLPDLGGAAAGVMLLHVGDTPRRRSGACWRKSARRRCSARASA